MVIVAAVDTSERAQAVAEEAEQLAQAFGHSIHVVHCLSNSEFIQLEQTSYEETQQAVPMEEVKSIAVERAKNAIDTLTEDHEFVGLVGSASRQIVQYCENHDAVYVVVAPRRRSPAGKVIFGSVAQSILLNAPCPVVTTIRSRT